MITSTESTKPATITNSLAIETNYITFSHLIFKWKTPEPWVCWNAEGDAEQMQKAKYSVPDNGEPSNKEDAVQMATNGKHVSFLYDEITNEDTNICLVIDGEHTLIENDRIYGCGPEFKGTKTVVNEEAAWHCHGIYDYGKFTEIKNNYIYGNSRNGILF